MGPVCSRGVPRAPRYSGAPGLVVAFATGLSPSMVELSRSIHKGFHSSCWCPNTGPKTGLGWSAFVRHYLRNRVCFLFLQLLRCFSSLGSLLTLYAFKRRYPLRDGFPHSEILTSLPGCRLRETYRRLLRPSSPLNAKTSTICPYCLVVPTRSRRKVRFRIQHCHCRALRARHAHVPAPT